MFHIESSTHDDLSETFWSEGFLFLLALFEDDTKIQYHVFKVSDGSKKNHLTVRRPPELKPLVWQLRLIEQGSVEVAKDIVENV